MEGVLKGYDLLLNLVLDDCIELLQGAISLSGFCFAKKNAMLLVVYWEECPGVLGTSGIHVLVGLLSFVCSNG